MVHKLCRVKSTFGGIAHTVSWWMKSSTDSWLIPKCLFFSLLNSYYTIVIVFVLIYFILSSFFWLHESTKDKQNALSDQNRVIIIGVIIIRLYFFSHQGKLFFSSLVLSVYSWDTGWEIRGVFCFVFYHLLRRMISTWSISPPW